MKKTTIVHRVFSGILLCTFCYDSFEEVLSINEDPTGHVGSDGTYIECLINMNGIRSVREVSIYAFINETMTVIITYYDYGVTVLSQDGEYLKGRVTYTTITGQSNRATLSFSSLQCEDDTDYQCHLLYEPNSPGPSVRAVSELSHLNVQVLPSRPDYIKVDNIQDKTSSEHKFVNSVFLEGDVISVTCAGEVGKPIRNLIVKKMRTHGMDYNLTQVKSPVNEGIPKCSFYQNNTFTTTLTGEDNGSILRCAVEGFTNNDKMSIKTNKLVVMYPVQIPDIHVYPSTSTMPPVTLHCIGKGNPEPYFAWYKLSKINITNSFEFLASTPVIILNKTSDSGVYRCEVYNNIAQNSYRNSSNVTVTFQEYPNTDIDSETDKSCYCVPAVLGGVFGSLGICIVPLAIVYISKHRSSKRNKETKCPTTSIPDQDLSSQYEEIRRETDNRHTEAARHLSSSYEGIGSERTNHEYSELQ